MKSKKWIALLMLLGVMVFAACDGEETTKEDVTVMQQEVETDSIIPTEDVQTAETRELQIYYSDCNAEGLEIETISVETVTPEVLISNLAKYNIVSIDTKVISFEEVEEDGKSILNLDLTKAFGEYLGTMGTSGELVIISALTNTFLEAYDADALWLTAGGKMIETGHTFYDEPLTFRPTDFRGIVESDIEE